MSNGAVMVTGGAGFVGRNIVSALLERGDRVVVYDLAGGASAPDGSVIFERGDLGDIPHLLNACREHGVDRILHTAAIFDPAFSQANPYATYVANVLGTINVIEVSRLSDVKQLVLISTGAVYQAVTTEPISEEHAIFSSSEGTPAGHYGASKAATDIIGMTYATNSGVDVRIVRYSGVYGYGMRHDLYVKSMVEAAAAGRELAVPSGAEMKRDYLYIKDAVQGTLAALDADAATLRQRVFNIASGEIVTTSQLAALVSELSGTKISVGSGLSEFEVNDIRTRGRVDISAAKRDLGYVPEFDLRKGVSAFLDSARSDFAQSEKSK